MATVPKNMFLLDCPTYQDYLDTFIKRRDIHFLRNKRFARMLVELGYRSKSEIYTPEEFEEEKAAVREALWPTKKGAICFSETYFKSDEPVLLEMAARERPNMQKMIATIIFVKHRLTSGFYISGYIDYEQSLREANLNVEGCTDWAGVYTERIKLKAKPSDLSYCDWQKGHVFYNNTDNFIVVPTVEYGLMFKHMGDHKYICLDVSKPLYSHNCRRAMHFSERYGYVVFYDHIIRRKN